MYLPQLLPSLSVLSILVHTTHTTFPFVFCVLFKRRNSLVEERNDSLLYITKNKHTSKNNALLLFIYCLNMWAIIYLWGIIYETIDSCLGVRSILLICRVFYKVLLVLYTVTLHKLREKKEWCFFFHFSEQENEEGEIINYLFKVT